jgi:hypothetical protein
MWKPGAIYAPVYFRHVWHSKESGRVATLALDRSAEPRLSRGAPAAFSARCSSDDPWDYPAGCLVSNIPNCWSRQASTPSQGAVPIRARTI